MSPSGPCQPAAALPALKPLASSRCAARKRGGDQVDHEGAVGAAGRSKRPPGPDPRHRRAGAARLCCGIPRPAAPALSRAAGGAAGPLSPAQRFRCWGDDAAPASRPRPPPVLAAPAFRLRPPEAISGAPPLALSSPEPRIREPEAPPCAPSLSPRSGFLRGARVVRAAAPSPAGRRAALRTVMAQAGEGRKESRESAFHRLSPRKPSNDRCLVSRGARIRRGRRSSGPPASRLTRVCLPPQPPPAPSRRRRRAAGRLQRRRRQAVDQQGRREGAAAHRRRLADQVRLLFSCGWGHGSLRKIGVAAPSPPSPRGGRALSSDRPSPSGQYRRSARARPCDPRSINHSRNLTRAPLTTFLAPIRTASGRSTTRRSSTTRRRRRPSTSTRLRPSAPWRRRSATCWSSAGMRRAPCPSMFPLHFPFRAGPSSLHSPYVLPLRAACGARAQPARSDGGEPTRSAPKIPPLCRKNARAGMRTSTPKTPR